MLFRISTNCCSSFGIKYITSKIMMLITVTTNYVCIFKTLSIVLFFVIYKLPTASAWDHEKEGDGTSKGLGFTTDRWLTVPRGLHQVLASIDDKLRSLDTFSHTLRLGRLDYFMDHMTRRLENIETKLGTLETTLDIRIRKIEEVIIGKDIKEELSNDHLSRKMSNINDKLNNKVSFLDAKIDIRTERITNKLELLERDIQGSMDDVLEKLVKSDERHAQFEKVVLSKLQKFEEVANNFNDVRVFLKEELTNIIKHQAITIKSKTESSVNNILQGLDVMKREMGTFHHNTTKECSKVGNYLKETVQQLNNRSLMCFGDNRKRSSTHNFSHVITDTNCTSEHVENVSTTVRGFVNEGKKNISELNSVMKYYMKKIIGGVQHLFNSSEEIKIFLRDLTEQGNKTKNIIYDEFNMLQQQLQPIPLLEPKILHLGESLNKRVAELSKVVDSSFATLLVAQNTFISSCKRIQAEETHVYNILQKIVLEMRNRSIDDIHLIRREIQTHSAEIDKTLTRILSSLKFVNNSIEDEIKRILMTTSENLIKECALSSRNLGNQRNKSVTEEENEYKKKWQESVLDSIVNIQEYDIEIKDELNRSDIFDDINETKSTVAIEQEPTDPNLARTVGC
ncbi:uncharacterized protein LOC143250461 isoform X2 [Tachypleus tridentatus]|uniref:uncharacterized protein LOC143250461 isoform X2 n=2 Tax=Tachypleus tridentatus TaxID=6853 RepID=UPI003FD1C09A